MQLLIRLVAVAVAVYVVVFDVDVAAGLVVVAIVVVLLLVLVVQHFPNVEAITSSIGIATLLISTTTTPSSFLMLFSQY